MQIGTSLLLLFAGGSVVCRKICRGTCCEIMRPNPAGQGGRRRRLEVLAPGAELASSLRFPAQRAVRLVFKSFVLHDFPLHIDFSTSLGLFSSAEKRTSPSPAPPLPVVSQWMTKISLPGKIHKGKVGSAGKGEKEGGGSIPHETPEEEVSYFFITQFSSFRCAPRAMGGRWSEARMKDGKARVPAESGRRVYVKETFIFISIDWRNGKHWSFLKQLKASSKTRFVVIFMSRLNVKTRNNWYVFKAWKNYMNTF